MVSAGDFFSPDFRNLSNRLIHGYTLANTATQVAKISALTAQ
jgi:hypothetical protein